MTTLRIRIDLGSIVKDNPRWLFLRDSCLTIQDVIEKIVSDYSLLNLSRNVKLYLNGAILPPSESVAILQPEDIIKVLVEEEEVRIFKKNGPASHLISYPSPLSSLVTNLQLDARSNNSLLSPIPTDDNVQNTSQSLIQKEIENFNLHVSNEIEVSNEICQIPKKQSNSETSSPNANSMKVEAIKNSKHKTILLSKLRNPGSKASCSTMFSNVSDQFNDKYSKLSENQRKEMLALEEARKQSAANIKIKLGEFGEEWTKGWRSSDCCIMFECGVPDQMWLYAQSQGLNDVNSFVQKLKIRELSKTEVEHLSEGSLVIAVYLVDYQLYRAKIERIEVAMDGEKTFRVRFIDYGNVSEVGAKHLHPWDPILDIIPPQATCARLKDSYRFVSTLSPKSEEAEEFANIMKRNNPFYIVVKEVFKCKKEMLDHSKLQTPCILAELHQKSGEGIMAKLKTSKYFKDLLPESSIVSSSDKVSSSRLYSSSDKQESGLTRSNLDMLDYKTPSKLTRVPEPLHLKEEMLDLSDDGSCISPVHPLQASRAVEKVQWWLEKDESLTDDDRKRFLTRKKKTEDRTVFREPEMKSKTVESKRKLLANAKKSTVGSKTTSIVTGSVLNSLKIQPEVPSITPVADIFQFPSADVRSSSYNDENIYLYNCGKEQEEDVEEPGRGLEETAKEGQTDVSNNKDEVISKEDFLSVHVPVDDAKDVFNIEEVSVNVSPVKVKDPDEAVRVNNEVPSRIEDDYSPPQYQSQTIENTDGQFGFMICHVNDVHSLYIHPIQDQTMFYEELKPLLKKEVNMAEVDFDKVEIGTVWILQIHEEFHRVAIQQVDFSLKTAEVLLIDWGSRVKDVQLDKLLRVPPGAGICSLPGLAVPCQLANVHHSFVNNFEARILLEETLSDDQVYEALLVESSKDSNSIIVFVGDTTLNEMILDLKSCDEKDEGSNESIGWNPMKEDYDDLANNYCTNDDDVQIATDGYKTKENICHFFVNGGKCYKGDYCEDKHCLPRSGAVTADKEVIVVDTLDQLKIPVIDNVVIVNIVHVNTPSCFYIRLPFGDENISKLTEEIRKQIPNENDLKKLESKMQEVYTSSRRYFMDTLPSPGSLVACKVNGRWKRGQVMEDVDEEATNEVYLVDEGFTASIEVKKMRKLDESFSILPFQVVECCLDQLEPPSGTWSKRAKERMLELSTSCDYVTAAVKGTIGEKLAISINACFENNQIDIGAALCKEDMAVKEKSSVKPKSSKNSIAHVPG